MAHGRRLSHIDIFAKDRRASLGELPARVQRIELFHDGKLSTRKFPACDAENAIKMKTIDTRRGEKPLSTQKHKKINNALIHTNRYFRAVTSMPDCRLNARIHPINRIKVPKILYIRIDKIGRHIKGCLRMRKGIHHIGGR